MMLPRVPRLDSRLPASRMSSSKPADRVIEEEPPSAVRARATPSYSAARHGGRRLPRHWTVRLLEVRGVRRHLNGPHSRRSLPPPGPATGQAPAVAGVRVGSAAQGRDWCGSRRAGARWDARSAVRGKRMCKRSIARHLARRPALSDNSGDGTDELGTDSSGRDLFRRSRPRARIRRGDREAVELWSTCQPTELCWCDAQAKGVL